MIIITFLTSFYKTGIYIDIYVYMCVENLQTLEKGKDGKLANERERAKIWRHNSRSVYVFNCHLLLFTLF